MVENKKYKSLNIFHFAENTEKDKEDIFMRRETINCDRCGKILKDEARPFAITEWETKFGKMEQRATVPYDLCPSCQDAFLKFIKDYSKE